MIQIWIALPILCAGISAYLVIGPLIEYPSTTYAIAAGLIFAGLIFYIPFIYFNLSVPFQIMDKLEIFLQMFFEVVPVESNESEEKTK